MIGPVLKSNGFRVASIRRFNDPKKMPEEFYAIHKDRPFFKDLVEFMKSGPVWFLS